MTLKRQKALRKIPISRYPFTSAKYPGSRPRFSFLFTSKGIYRLKLRTLRKSLQDRGLPSLDDRYAVVAYGSNACPGQLTKKELTDVPVIYGRLVGAEAVYARRRTQKGKGYVPVTLARKSGSQASWITLLTREQIGIMDGSEGRHGGSYALAELRDVQFIVGKSKKFAPLYTYVNILGGVMLHAGKAVSLRSTNQKKARRLFADSAEGAAANFLTYAVIPDPQPPTKHSQVVQR